MLKIWFQHNTKTDLVVAQDRTVDKINSIYPLSIYQKLRLGKIKLITVTLQLANCFLTYHRGIVEDVLVKVDKFIFPVDVAC